MPSARRFADHGAVSEGAEIPRIEPVALGARTVPKLADEDGPPPAQEELVPRLLRAAE